MPLTVWFQGIYFMTQDKKGASAMKLHRQLGISYNAAWRMRHKLMQVMMERDREHPLGGFIQLDDAYLGGERSGGKRGRGAPGKTPFVAAVETNEAGHPQRVKLTVVEGFRLTEIAAWAQQHLSPGTQVLSDGLACFNGVTAAGCVHEPISVPTGFDFLLSKTSLTLTSGFPVTAGPCRKWALSDYYGPVSAHGYSVGQTVES